MNFSLKIKKPLLLATLLQFNLFFGTFALTTTSNFKPKQPPTLIFKENKGQVHDQNYKQRPDVLFSGTDGNLVYHLKTNGISYQINKVDEWAEI